ncbi:MAG: chloride channel protein [Saprospiraceae bacterium]|nr:chloride channel protein [Saprospiraceae bacterium]
MSTTKGFNKGKGIPISVSLKPHISDKDFGDQNRLYNRKRMITISAFAIFIAICISFIAKFLIHLIDLITNISFFGLFSPDDVSPADNHLGLYVIAIPTIGGLIVGIMALYGSKAIRGHGIPEAMEQILTNQSKIKPAITFLKPISSAISIGTGGPFGAEGPIIATGGALGSTLGQIMKISDNERKILLAAGATAGMSAIFGTPIAAIFLAIELLLFEFSPLSIIPVSLACITGAAGHHLLFSPGVVFPVDTPIPLSSNQALSFYTLLGGVIGLASVLVTKIVYLIEDGFERLPIHWAWWPAIGGVVVGIVGYFNPHTLGVGYDNIIHILSGNMPMQVLLSLCVLKFVSWAISLGSGTSGGTLAPLLTIGGALGVLLGGLILQWFPKSGITMSLAAMVGMSSMFAGSSRAFITSIVFVLESTGEFNALLPLLAGCTCAYIISYFFMENTIMTEKIARRGVKTPDIYEPDILSKLSVEQMITGEGTIISENNSIGEVREWLRNNQDDELSNYFIISDDQGEYRGILSYSNLHNAHHNEDEPVGTLIKRNNVFISMKDTLLTAVETMARENVDVLPVISSENSSIIGIISYKDIIASYRIRYNEHEKKQTQISLKRNGLKILLRGQKIVTTLTRKAK